MFIIEMSTNVYILMYKYTFNIVDGFLNIAMEQTEEYVDGQLKNRYGDCFIRGNNGEIIYI
jgi:U6 snRNA-associated Sm-like protein LSm6